MNTPDERTLAGAASAGSHGLPRSDWNSTARTYPAALLHEAFEERVAGAPGTPAVRFRDEALTYGELNSHANRLAHRLIDIGARPGALVAVCMDRSLEMVVALYAILKSGAAYVPVDPEYPADRISFMLDDARAPILLSHRRLAHRLGSTSARIVEVDLSAPEQMAEPAGNPSSRAGPDDLAYVIYTSGSTGQPKGAMISHRAIANRIYWMQEAYGLTPADRVLQKTPFSFDVSVWEFFWPLLFGAELVVAEPGGHRDSTYLTRTIVERGITTIHFVPSMLQLFLEDPRAGDCSSLKRVICSGEALPKALQDRFFARLGAELHNLYGPTEAAVDVTAWRCDRDSELSFVPIGKPVANTQIHILDEEMRPVPVGTAGELHIGGVQVGSGYLRRPELTAARFVPDPFTPRSGGTLYKTGDLARYMPDGNIEFLGRADFQVKIRGFRVELGEIESALESVADVRQAVVVAHQDSSGDLELVAYVSLSGQDTSLESLQRHLRTQLPEYMVPTTFVAVEAFVLTPSGKIDRKALPVPVRQRPLLGASYVAPRSRLEALIVEKWQRILGLDQVGIHDRFFELGGTSLQAARFVNQMQADLDETIFVVTLFSAPSVAEYAAFLEAQYPAAVARIADPGAAAIRPMPSRATITEEDLARLVAAIPTKRRPVADREERNPTAIFILSPPRSGTTLLRIMLAGHPDLFAASELQLLGFDTLRERAAAYSGRFSGWLDGAVRAVMQAEHLEADDAKALIRAAEAEDLTTKQFFGRLQASVQPKTIVDKSPSYAMDPGALRMAELEVDGARFIHLVRDPRAMIESFARHHMAQILYLGEHPFDPRQLAELVWTLSHRNITEFLADVPKERWFRLRFEDLVRDPAGQMEALCGSLGLAFDPAVLRPYDGLDDKMVDGVYAESAPMGDPGFLAHGRIDPSVAAAGSSGGSPLLGTPTLDLAADLGYQLIADKSPARRSQRGSLSRQGTLRRSSRGRDDG